MLKSLLNDLVNLGEVVLFGSTLDPHHRYPSDIDIAVIASKGRTSEVRDSVHTVLKKNGLDRFARVQHLLAYERSCSKPTSLLHILVCDSADLETNHPIVKKVYSGLYLRG